MVASAILIGLLLPLGRVAVAAPQAPEPSSGPQCTYICPPFDKAGWRPVPFLDPSPNEIFCSYPTVPEENPLDFYCIYSKIDSHLVYDHNADLCQENAVCADPGARRAFRNGLGRKNPLPTRGTRPAQSEGSSDIRPSVMKTRVALGKEKKRASATKTLQ